MKKYKKYVVGKISRDLKGEESFVYFPVPVEESSYAEKNNLDMTKLASVRDLIVIYLTDSNGTYTLDPVLKTFVYIEDEKLWVNKTINMTTVVICILDYI